MSLKMLVDRYKVQEEVEEQRKFWLLSVLYSLGIDVDAFYDVDAGIFDDYLFSIDIEIIDYPSIGALMVKHEGEIVAEWGGPEMELKADSDGEYYFEVTIEEWSVLSDEIDTAED